jgi:hypothetical protein
MTIKKRQLKKNGRVPKWLKRFRKNNNLSMLSWKDISKSTLLNTLETGIIHHEGCSLVTCTPEEHREIHRLGPTTLEEIEKYSKRIPSTELVAEPIQINDLLDRIKSHG